MTKISETGHAVNVANFENLLTTANALGATYNPSQKAVSKFPLYKTFSLLQKAH